MLPFVVGLFALVLSCAQVRAQSCDAQWLPGDGFAGAYNNVASLVVWDQDGAGPIPARLVAAISDRYENAPKGCTVAMFNESVGRWQNLASRLEGVSCLAVLPDGRLVVAGEFLEIDGNPFGRIAAWDGQTWAALGTGLGARVNALLVLSTGELLAGGEDRMVGNIPYSHIAKWNGTTWSDFANTLTGSVVAMTELPNGDIVACGGFQFGSNTRVRGIARFDGTKWRAMGGGLPSNLQQSLRTYTVAALADGSVIAGGRELLATDGTVCGLARWDGNAWTSFGNVVGSVSEAQMQADGTVLIAGGFSAGPDGSLKNVARWDGTQWLPVGNPSQISLNAVAQFPDGDVAVGGYFSAIGEMTADSIARWDGQKWRAVGPPIGGLNNGHRGWNTRAAAIYSMVEMANGDVVVGGDFLQAGAGPASYLARWDGVSWAPFGGGTNGPVNSLALLANGDVIAGGSFTNAGGTSAASIARWNGATWEQLGEGFDGPVNAVAVSKKGKIVAAGNFSHSGSRAVRSIAVFDGTNWQPLGEGLGSLFRPTGNVYRIQILPNGNIVATGDIALSGEYHSSPIVLWNGAVWTSMEDDSYSPTGPAALCTTAAGRLVASARFSRPHGLETGLLMEWDGSKWIALATEDVLQYCTSLLQLRNGDFVVSGQLDTVLRWDGHALAPLGATFGKFRDEPSGPFLFTFLERPNGDLWVGGEFGSVGPYSSLCLARWSQTQVPPIAQQPVGVRVRRGTPVTLSAAIPNGYSGVHYEWLWSEDGVTFATGGLPTGEFYSPTIAATTELSIGQVSLADAGQYRVRFWNQCGETVSETAHVQVSASYADFNADGLVDDADFVLFVGQYEIMLCADAQMPEGCFADLNGDQVVDDADFTLFLPDYLALLVQ